MPLQRHHCARPLSATSAPFEQTFAFVRLSHAALALSLLRLALQPVDDWVCALAFILSEAILWTWPLEFQVTFANICYSLKPSSWHYWLLLLDCKELGFSCFTISLGLTLKRNRFSQVSLLRFFSHFNVKYPVSELSKDSDEWRLTRLMFSWKYGFACVYHIGTNVECHSYSFTLPFDCIGQVALQLNLQWFQSHNC